MAIRLEPSDPDVPATYSIDWRDVLVDAAERGSDVADGAFLRYPHIDTGFYYEVTTAGRLSQFFPMRLPRTAAATVNDGSAVLTCRHPDDSTLKSISSATWVLDTGLTKDSQAESGFITSITVSGGSDGVDYEVTCTISPSSGDDVERTIIIPRRAL